jgi:hypothetical protein
MSTEVGWLAVALERLSDVSDMSDSSDMSEVQIEIALSFELKRHNIAPLPDYYHSAQVAVASYAPKSCIIWTNGSASHSGLLL